MHCCLLLPYCSNVIIMGSTLIMPKPMFAMATTPAATTTVEVVEIAWRKKTKYVVHSPRHHNRPSVISTSPPAEHRQHRTRQRQCTRECQRTDLTRNNASRMAVEGQSSNNGCILTPKMLNASNSRSLRDLLGNETNSNTTSSSRTAYHRTTLNTGTRLFRSDHSTTYFTTGTGRIFPTTMHQTQQHCHSFFPDSCAAHPLQKQQQQKSKSNPNPALIHHQNKSPPHVISASNPKEARRDNAVMIALSAASPAAFVDESLDHHPKTSSSTSRQRLRRLTFPTNDASPDLPFVPTLNRSENVVSGHHHQGGRRRHTVTSIANVKPPSDPCTTSCCATNQPFKRDDSIAVNIKQMEEVSLTPPATTAKGNAPDPPATPYHELKMSSSLVANHVSVRSRPISEARHNLSCMTSLNTSPKMVNRRPFLHSMMMQDQSNHQYQVGETLRDESHSIAFTSSTQAKILVSKLPVNSPLFVKRTSREWTYAVLVRWRDEQEQHPDVSDTEGHAVKEEELLSSLVVSLHSTRNARKVLNRSQWEKCLRLVNSQAVVNDDVATIAATAASPVSVAEGYVSFETSTPKTSSETIMMTPSAPRLNTSRSARSTMSDHYSTADSVTSILSSADAVVGNPLVVRNLFPTVSLDDREKNTPTSLTMTASLNKLHSKNFLWRDLDDVSSKSDATPVRSGAIASGLPGSETDNTNSQTSSESPDTVNLHAMHFWGSRRDRMRPRGIHRIKSRNSGCVSLCGDKDRAQQRMWCDLTCSPESGSFSDASGGSVWNTLLDNNSQKKHDATTIPTLPYYFPTSDLYSSSRSVAN